MDHEEEVFFPPGINEESFIAEFFGCNQGVVHEFTDRADISFPSSNLFGDGGINLEDSYNYVDDEADDIINIFDSTLPDPLCVEETTSEYCLQTDIKDRKPDRKTINGSIKLKKEEDLNEKTFACTECDYKTCFKRDLEKHKRAGHGEKLASAVIEETNESNIHTCIICNQVCESLGKLGKHLINAHKNENTYLCKKCGFHTLAKESLKKHRLLTHKKVKLFECIPCNFSSPYKKSLKFHIERVHNANAVVHYCQECTFKSERKSQIKYHIANIHMNEYVCHICKPSKKSVFQIRLPHDLKKSIDRALESSKPFTLEYACFKCNFKSILKEELMDHIKKGHYKELHFCEMCSYSTASKGRLAQHTLKIHPGTELSVQYAESSSPSRLLTSHDEFSPNGEDSLKYDNLTSDTEDVDETSEELYQEALFQDSCSIGNVIEVSVMTEVPKECVIYPSMFIQCENCDFFCVHISSLRDHMAAKHPSKTLIQEQMCMEKRKIVNESISNSESIVPQILQQQKNVRRRFRCFSTNSKEGISDYSISETDRSPSRKRWKENFSMNDDVIEIKSGETVYRIENPKVNLVDCSQENEPTDLGENNLSSLYECNRCGYIAKSSRGLTQHRIHSKRCFRLSIGSFSSNYGVGDNLYEPVGKLSDTEETLQVLTLNHCSTEYHQPSPYELIPQSNDSSIMMEEDEILEVQTLVPNIFSNSDFVECQICHFKSTESSLESHIHLAHGVQQPFVCCYCGFNVFCKQVLIKHMEMHLSREKKSKRLKLANRRASLTDTVKKEIEEELIIPSFALTSNKNRGEYETALNPLGLHNGRDLFFQ